ncbi:hypothetical protein [Chryseobacterium wangxinyae]|uniref:hypothetical protein n=1 Tax=Chryseobacterium sp. CY353 TaxID=2997334 RepID=UPI002271070B|nr:hypothetical protein [Chryseobacterium sp. CY353]MCY0971100.1 hypothetical protein [Chryseobacterium sp. CY353]
MLSLKEWQEFATVNVQDNYALLKKSTLPGTGKMPGNVPPESGKIEFVDSGQVNVPESINTTGAPVPENDIKVNGYFTTTMKIMKEELRDKRIVTKMMSMLVLVMAQVKR